MCPGGGEGEGRPRETRGRDEDKPECPRELAGAAGILRDQSAYNIIRGIVIEGGAHGG